MILTPIQSQLNDEILSLPSGIYRVSTIFNVVSKTRDVKITDVRWSLVFLNSINSKVRRVSRGLYSINQENNKIQQLKSSLSKISIEKLIKKDLAYEDFTTQLYNYRIINGIPIKSIYIVDKSYKNKILQQGNSIKYRNIDKYGSIGKTIFMDYLSHVNQSDYSFFPILFDVINKYKLQIYEFNNICNKNKLQLAKLIFTQKEGYAR